MNHESPDRSSVYRADPPFGGVVPRESDTDGALRAETIPEMMRTDEVRARGTEARVR